MRESEKVLVLDGRVAQLINAAALAGAYSETMRRLPQTRGGFERLRVKHSEAVRRLADEIAADAARQGNASVGT